MIQNEFCKDPHQFLLMRMLKKDANGLLEEINLEDGAIVPNQKQDIEVGPKSHARNHHLTPDPRVGGKLCLRYIFIEICFEKNTIASL